MKKRKLKKCFFWGAAGQAKVLKEFAMDSGYELSWLFDNNPRAAASIDGIPVVGGWKRFLAWSKKIRRDNIAFAVALGGDNEARLTIQKKIERLGFRPLTLIHRTSYVARNASVGNGSQILAGATICAEAKIGEGCIINTGTQIDHECVIGDGVHVMPGAVLAGYVRVGKFAFIGSGAIILPRITIGENSFVGAGAVVTRNVKPRTVVVGVPARFLKKYR